MGTPLQATVAHQLAVILSATAFRFIQPSDLKERRRISIFIALAIMGSLFVPLVLLITDTPECNNEVCSRIGNLIINMSDALSVIAFGLAAVSRARAMTEPSQRRPLYFLYVIYFAYVVVNVLDVLFSFGVTDSPFNGIFIAANLAVTLNTLCVELYILCMFRRGLKQEVFRGLRKELFVIQSLMVFDFVAMTVACLLAVLDPQGSGYSLIVFATSSHVFSFCLLNRLITRTYTKVVDDDSQNTASFSSSNNTASGDAKLARMA